MKRRAAEIVVVTLGRLFVFILLVLAFAIFYYSAEGCRCATKLITGNDAVEDAIKSGCAEYAGLSIMRFSKENNGINASTEFALVCAACESGSAEVVNMVMSLVSPRVLVYASEEEHGDTVLHQCARGHCNSCCAALISHGSDTSTRNKRGELPEDVSSSVAMFVITRCTQTK